MIWLDLTIETGGRQLLGAEQWAQIRRRAYVEKLSQREIHRRTGTLRKALYRAVPFVDKTARTTRKELVMNAQQKIAVTGATGRVGSHLVELLESSGHEVVSISRSNGVDVITGEGLKEALEGVNTVVDTATGDSPDKDAAMQFFVTAARNLQDAGEQAGVRRIVVVSIIGCDRFTGGSYGGYYAAKVTQEQTLLDGPIPVQILQASPHQRR